MIEERIHVICDKWFMREPVLLMTLLSHSVVANPKIKTIRSGKGRIEYNSDYILNLTDVAFEETLKIEVIRILLRHPYRFKPDSNAELAYIASNITLNEYYTLKSLPYKANEFWKDKSFYMQNSEFYYSELVKLFLQASASGGAVDIEKTSLWEEDEFIDKQIDDIITFAKQSMSWGTIPQKLVQIIIASLTPVIDYRKILRSFRSNVLSSRKMLTRTKPSRRYGFMYMGKKYEFTTRLLIGIDVSGSISDTELNVFYSVINRFFKYGIESLDALQFDCEIKGEPVVLKEMRKKILIKGRGGTNFQPIIDYFGSRQKTYAGLIIFTDGYAKEPQAPPGTSSKILFICNNKKNWMDHREWMTRIGRCCWIEGG
jgi:predicted metal-dependent peptidase